MADYGTVEERLNEDGSMTILRADPVVGIAVEVLVNPDPRYLRVTTEGHLSLGSHGLTLYRPVRFDPASGGRVLICERVRR